MADACWAPGQGWMSPTVYLRWPIHILEPIQPYKFCYNCKHFTLIHDDIYCNPIMNFGLESYDKALIYIFMLKVSRMTSISNLQAGNQNLNQQKIRIWFQRSESKSYGYTVASENLAYCMAPHSPENNYFLFSNVVCTTLMNFNGGVLSKLFKYLLLQSCTSLHRSK